MVRDFAADPYASVLAKSVVRRAAGAGRSRRRRAAGVGLRGRRPARGGLRSCRSTARWRAAAGRACGRHAPSCARRRARGPRCKSGGGAGRHRMHAGVSGHRGRRRMHEVMRSAIEHHSAISLRGKGRRNRDAVRRARADETRGRMANLCDLTVPGRQRATAHACHHNRGARCG